MHSSEDPDVIFKQIIEENNFPPMFKVPSSLVDNSPITLGESKGSP
jgi:hypothetical protein